MDLRPKARSPGRNRALQTRGFRRGTRESASAFAACNGDFRRRIPTLGAASARSWPSPRTGQVDLLPGATSRFEAKVAKHLLALLLVHHWLRNPHTSTDRRTRRSGGAPPSRSRGTRRPAGSGPRAGRSGNGSPAARHVPIAERLDRTLPDGVGQAERPLHPAHPTQDIRGLEERFARCGDESRVGEFAAPRAAPRASSTGCAGAASRTTSASGKGRLRVTSTAVLARVVTPNPSSELVTCSVGNSATHCCSCAPRSDRQEPPLGKVSHTGSCAQSSCRSGRRQYRAADRWETAASGFTNCSAQAWSRCWSPASSGQAQHRRTRHGGSAATGRSPTARWTRLLLIPRHRRLSAAGSAGSEAPTGKGFSCLDLRHGRSEPVTDISSCV